MAKDEIVFDGRELLASVTLGVRMPHSFGLRIWMATKLFELAGWVSGTNVVIEIDDEDPSVFRLPAGYTFTPLGAIMLVSFIAASVGGALVAFGKKIWAVMIGP